jgi:EamA domain-containing membrane protein RarD
MMAGQVYLVLGLVSFSLLGILHKVADVKQSRPPAINALLMISSLLLVLLYVLSGTSDGPAVPARVTTIALPFGVAASVAILAFQAGIKYGSIATSWLAINLSAGIPTVASILIYDEPVSAGKAVALSLIPVSMFLLWKDKAAAEARVQTAKEERA